MMRRPRVKGQEAIFFSFEIEFRFLSESKDSNISAPGVEALEGRKSLPCDLLLSYLYQAILQMKELGVITRHRDLSLIHI